MTTEPISTRRPSAGDKVLKEKFAESIAGQSDLMDRLGQQLIVIELAIPGLFATVLKLIKGDKATVAGGISLYITFGCWFAALILTLVGLTPRRWRVNTDILKRDDLRGGTEMGVEDFFHASATYKRRFLVSAILIFFWGIASAAYSVF